MATLNPMSGVRQRRYRERLRDHRAVARVEYTDEVIYALITQGRLTQAETERRELVERELVRIIKEWVEVHT
jgi:hypothetical protein